MNSVESVQRPPVTSRGGEAAQPVDATTVARPRSLGVYWLPAITLIIGLIVTGALVVVSHSQYVSNEKRVLKLRVRDAGALVVGALPGVQTPLASAAELADATHGNVAKFKAFAAPYVGSAGSAHQYVSLSLWRISSLASGPVAVQGAAPVLAAQPGTASAFLAAAARSPKLSGIGLLRVPAPRLGYAYANPDASGGYVVYGESALPASRRSRLQDTSAFAGLDYALYLGHKQAPSQLLVTNVGHFPLPSPSAADTVDFGNSAFTLAMSSRAPLTGSLPRDLPWIIAVLGVLLSLAAATLTLRLTQRRRAAEGLAQRLEVTASENERLYDEQRDIAQTLQHALLPDILPRISGIETSARYEAGEQGVEVGGDWYDVIALDASRLLLVVGDVSGRGLRAATTMASLRYAIRAYAAQSDDPAEILTKISRLVDVAESGQLATVLCAIVDTESRELTVTSAGHLPPLLLSDGEGRFLDSDVGLPIGVEEDAEYRSTTVTVPPGATVLAFTDGLVETRGESLDAGLERLRAAATRHHVGLPELLGMLVNELVNGRSEDDIAIVGVRWTS
ncbi:MAG: PP2C family protein-serine/threonine phosphatase [Solirubrobacteraceae bacterium]